MFKKQSLLATVLFAIAAAAPAVADDMPGVTATEIKLINLTVFFRASSLESLVQQFVAERL